MSKYPMIPQMTAIAAVKKSHTNSFRAENRFLPFFTFFFLALSRLFLVSGPPDMADSPPSLCAGSLPSLFYLK
jgi:hypothetical protein